MALVSPHLKYAIIVLGPAGVVVVVAELAQAALSPTHAAPLGLLALERRVDPPSYRVRHVKLARDELGSALGETVVNFFLETLVVCDHAIRHVVVVRVRLDLSVCVSYVLNIRILLLGVRLQSHIASE